MLDPGGGQDRLPKGTFEQKAGEPEPADVWRVLQAECTARPRAESERPLGRLLQ